MTSAERELLTRLVVAVDRMRDDWAESDKDVQQGLWKAVHTINEIVAEVFDIYPLAVAR